jgi:hypothetical protein
MAIDLITRNEYKNYLGITSSNKDQEIDLLIPKVSSLVKTYCRRTFIDHYNDPKVEVFEGGFDRLWLKEYPIREILYAETSTDYGQTYTNMAQYTDWILDGDSIRSIKNPYYFLPLIKGYQITYLGGYEDPPEDLKLAVLDLVEYYSKNNSAVHVNRDVTPNVTQIQYVTTTNFPAHIKRILDQYVSDYV